jgi:hypothetical protein
MTPSAVLLVAAGHSAPQVQGARFRRDPSTVSSRSCLGELGRRARLRSARLHIYGRLRAARFLAGSCCGLVAAAREGSRAKGEAVRAERDLRETARRQRPLILSGVPQRRGLPGSPGSDRGRGEPVHRRCGLSVLRPGRSAMPLTSLPGRSRSSRSGLASPALKRAGAESARSRELGSAGPQMLLDAQACRHCIYRYPWIPRSTSGYPG